MMCAPLPKKVIGVILSVLKDVIGLCSSLPTCLSIIFYAVYAACYSEEVPIAAVGDKGYLAAALQQVGESSIGTIRVVRSGGGVQMRPS